MCISKRLRQVCEAKNWKITDFAEQAGIAYRTMQGYIGGEREPNAEGMTGIAKAGVNLNWLVSGEGEMFQSVIQKNEISEQEEKLIADYRSMPENLKDAFSISFKEISNKQ
ncbi:helix-turn-helix transcriptional regulator [uncultured Haemophilus sp.]|uniref:helix-turn-helix domain-containing protein n=1 Tax=uncultured Haemophilus sp. TaxID=237779 RepID=UPI0025877F1F|nr:helix-turn-helix transcriptional regulator [uncultured Haemophilus sp.]